MITIDPNEPIKALSWKQPYLGLMFHGKIETRTWPTNYRGLVLMCASKTPYGTDSIMKISGQIEYRRIFKLIHEHQKGFFNNGSALAIGRLVDCHPTEMTENTFVLGFYGDGLYSHVYKDVTPIEPFPWKGSQGFRNVTKEERSKIKLLPKTA